MEPKIESGDIRQSKSKEIRLVDLFSSKRVSFMSREILLYVPVIPFFFFRLVISIFGFFLLWFSPSISFRSLLLKCISRSFGIVVNFDAKYRDENVKILVANHLSVLDKVAVNMMIPCEMLNNECNIEKLDIFSFWKETTSSYFKELTNNEIVHIKQNIERSSFALLHFPEGATTNGEVGLLKFHPSVFSLNSSIQPVLLKISKSSFMTISTSVLGSSSWKDIFWAFVCPTVHYSLKILPSMAKLPDESTEEFSKRVQHTMASSLNLESTIFTSYDKLELEKRLKSSKIVAPSKQNRQPESSLLTQNSTPTFGKSPKDRMASFQERRSALYEAARMKYTEKHSDAV